MKPVRHIDRRVRAATLGTLACALLGVTGSSVAQTAAPVGVTKPAQYECSGLEGVALSNCKDLNAAAANGAAALNATAPGNATHDCADMTGSALATCLDLNGQKAAPAMTDNGRTMQSPPGIGQAGTGNETGATGTPAGTDANSIAPRGGASSDNAGAATTQAPAMRPPAAMTPPSGLPANPTMPGTR